MWNAQYSRRPLLVPGARGARGAGKEPIAFAVPCAARRSAAAAGQRVGEPVVPCENQDGIGMCDDGGRNRELERGPEEDKADKVAAAAAFEDEEVLSRTNGVEVFASEHDAACECLPLEP